MRKIFCILICFISLSSAVKAQDTTEHWTSTFTIRAACDRKNGTGFSYGCSPKKISMEIFLCKGGGAYFYWNKNFGADGSKEDSLCISSDTAAINLVMRTISQDFVKKIDAGCPKCPDTQCGYFIRIVENGKYEGYNFAALDEATIKKYPDDMKRLQPLIDMLNSLMKKYGK